MPDKLVMTGDIITWFM